MMKKILAILISVSFISVCGFASDMRETSKLAEKEYLKSIERQNQVKNQIYQDKKELKTLVSSLENENKNIEAQISSLAHEIKELKEENNDLLKKDEENQSEFNELTGSVRVFAKELNHIFEKSVFTAFDKDRPSLLNPLLDKDRFPGIDDMKIMSDLFLKEAEITGDVFVKKSEYINNKGEKVSGDILTIGGFTSYTNDTFLVYNEKTKNFFELSKKPSFFVKKNINKYLNGNEESLYTDISGGGALLQISRSPGLMEKVKQGGILVWPILLIGLIALVIGIERTFFIRKVHENTDTVMGTVNKLAAGSKWDECDKIVGSHKNIPVYNVLRAGLKARNEDRETLESILQESILKELPRLERFLPLLNILGAIAPLIGLLGTVTGMINTFQVITVYGTGDPRMMSGGISTALITTMLGLSIAIPIMLLHTFLSRGIDHVIGDMEEKAVALTNIVFRDKGLR